mmetsp:Transcript_26330/g.51874  ORF Transcript_26330/g.51874 Transcript_26330/m.51874 type:complete len:141 (-) Transcript_26330:491-913(-)
MARRTGVQNGAFGRGGEGMKSKLDEGRLQTMLVTARADRGSRQRVALMSMDSPASTRCIDRRMSARSFVKVSSRALIALRRRVSPTNGTRHQNQIRNYDRKIPQEHGDGRGVHKGTPDSNTQKQNTQQTKTEKQYSLAKI